MQLIIKENFLVEKETPDKKQFTEGVQIKAETLAKIAVAGESKSKVDLS